MSEIDFYEDFHRDTRPVGGYPTTSDYTYGWVMKLIDSLGIQSTDLILDYGCGTGILTFYIAHKYGCHVIGVDISRRAIHLARASPLTKELNVSFMQGDLLHLNFNEKFDKAISIQVLEHVDKEQAVLRKIRSILKPTGVFFLTVPSLSDPSHRLRKLIYGFDPFDRDVGHLRRYSRRTIEQSLQRSGFRIDQVLEKEGFARIVLFTSKIGRRFRSFIVRKGLTHVVEFLDSTVFENFGAAQIVVTAKPRPC